ncbi:hypothetical protein ALC53_06381 [Atta colombica]|uniref:Uncharacterized protein n=1 Tax=Atta colombica TaxID=520822 RepID=A0A195BG21_9HYME|nr:hypothetical protein ALC53_06381 [Atta colombica]
MASKKKHVAKLPMASLTEPVRKSVLDVIQYNLRAIGYRMENIIRDLRIDYMPVTGLFLVYPLYYIHILEAWEDIIYKHYKLMYDMDDDKCKFGKAIPLPSYHHVHQRFFSGWCHVYMIPPILIGTLEAQTLDDILKQVSNCLIKVYTLCKYIANVMHTKRSKGDVKRPIFCTDVKQRFDEASKNYWRKEKKDFEFEISINIQDVLRNLGDKAAWYLPESTVLEFLLNVNSPVLKTVEEYLQMYSDASPSAFWDDNNVWPPPCDIMPRDAFDGRKVPDHRFVPGAFQEIAARCWVNVIALYSTVMKAPDCQPPANAEHLLFSGCAPIQTEWKKESHCISTGTTVDHRGSFHRKCKHAGLDETGTRCLGNVAWSFQATSYSINIGSGIEMLTLMECRVISICIALSRHSIHHPTSRLVTSEYVSDNASSSYSMANPTNYSIIRQHTDDASCTLHTAKATCVQALLYSKYDRKSASQRQLQRLVDICLSFPAFPAYLAQPLQLMIMHCTSLNL